MTRRRLLLTGLAGFGVIANFPAWAQAIAPQSDPWAQVDPYDDPRNGFSSQRAAPQARGGSNAADGVFRHGPRRQATPEEDRQEVADAARLYAGAMRDDGGPVTDRRIQAAMQSFIAPLTRVADRRALPWEARVARDASINAWTLGGARWRSTPD